MSELMFVMRMDKDARMSLVKALFSELPKWFQRETAMTSPFRELTDRSWRTALLHQRRASRHQGDPYQHAENLHRDISEK
ncbi:hypothetical protein AVEN_185037-1 [Araneus ventricosus]|uniref:Uncharacterized protein n=1 Tax=Araneus ventricosus TaxID=182803 RepID=A0A4Y2BQV3_ARAVE|nr:hypothetical protein AVEN_185037-1 [Araneus ventricosus]